MDEMHHTVLGGDPDMEKFDSADAAGLFHRINESWEEEYAAVFEESRDPEEDVPDDFLTGRRAYIFQMFYRVMVLHEDEARILEQRKRDAE
jgi:hypothetical protein